MAASDPEPNVRFLLQCGRRPHMTEADMTAAKDFPDKIGHYLQRGYSSLEMNCLNSAVCGRANSSDVGPLSQIFPRCMKTTWFATLRAKPISCVTVIIVMPRVA